MRKHWPIRSFLTITGTALLGNALLFCAGCFFESSSSAEEEGGRYVPVSLGEHTIHIQIARTPARRRQGLMYVESLPENHGMLFVSPKPERQSFWMKHTDIPLDIGFFDPEGVLREIYPLYPNDLTRVKSKGTQLVYALEMPRGWFADHDVEPGAKLDLQAILPSDVKTQKSKIVYLDYQN